MTVATLTRQPITEGAISVPEDVSGRIFTPGLPGARRNRVFMLLSDDDYEAFNNLSYAKGSRRPKVDVTDLLTGEYHTVRRASCGLGCFCAAEVVLDQ